FLQTSSHLQDCRWLDSILLYNYILFSAKNNHFRQNLSFFSNTLVIQTNSFLLNILFQELIDFLFCRRTAFQEVSELSGTLSNAQLSSLSPETLADADFLIQIFQQPLFLQTLKSRYQISVTGAAGFYLFYSIL